MQDPQDGVLQNHLFLGGLLAALLAIKPTRSIVNRAYLFSLFSSPDGASVLR